MRISIEINQPRWLASRPRLRKGIFVAAILGLFVIPGTVIASHQFADVPDSQPFHTEIDWMKDNAITQGSTECGTPPPGQEFYCPESTVRRDAMAAFLYRVANNQVVDAGWLEGKSLTDLDARYAPAGSGGSGWSLTGNSGTTPGTNFLGTTDNTALEVKVNSRRVLRVEPGAWPSLIFGSENNSITSGVIGATISGGGTSGLNANMVTDHWGTIGGGGNNLVGNDTGAVNDAAYATVGGGASNEARANYATVGGGNTNLATAAGAFVGGGVLNDATGAYAVIGGGIDNLASGFQISTVAGGQNNQSTGWGSFIGAGRNNVSSADWSTVGGGQSNTASNWDATVPGGVGNEASGQRSFAAGRRAKALHDGAFVWANGPDTDFASTGIDQFLVRATGGVGINTNTPNQELDVNGVIEADSLVYSTPHTHYLSLPGESFRPDSNTIAAFSGGGGNGGAYIVSGTGTINAPLYLPHGARITGFTAVFLDNSTSSITMSLMAKVHTSSGYSLISSVNSTGVSGTGSVASPALSRIVDNTDTGYMLRASSSSWDGSNLKVMGAVITYTISQAP